MKEKLVPVRLMSSGEPARATIRRHSDKNVVRIFLPMLIEAHGFTIGSDVTPYFDNKGRIILVPHTEK